ncbi:hypothetical protein P5673_014507 [Acropora cervicornis]|uniref:Reverse transcriptase domain-containing protein n=1 Tax=Acropora cervicornis TaxID=6130 RepID=A0AAD9V5V8_ACRCE|nr:hypothetical protein P5673_014507 [Acropora cervicornis]
MRKDFGIRRYVEIRGNRENMGRTRLICKQLPLLVAPLSHKVKCLSIGSHDFAFSHHVLVTNGDGWKEEIFISFKIFADDNFPALKFATVISKLDEEKSNTQGYQCYPDDLSYYGTGVQYEMKAVKNFLPTCIRKAGDTLVTAIDKILAIHVYRVSQSTSGVCFIEAELSVSWLKPLRADPVFADDDFPALEFAIVILKLDEEKSNTQRYQCYPDDLSYYGTGVQYEMKAVKSTELQLILNIHNTASSLQQNKSIHAVLLDFSKAFHKVPHQRFLMKLEMKLELYGIHGNLLSWMESFLMHKEGPNRHLTVKANLQSNLTSENDTVSEEKISESKSTKSNAGTLARA